MDKQKNLNNEYGVTLVSLVVTIVVMLILAGVSISMVVGENGVGTRAQYAAIDTETANIQDALSQAVASANTAYQTQKATNRKEKESPKYYTNVKLAAEGLEASKVESLRFYEKGAKIIYYAPDSNEGTKAWCNVILSNTYNAAGARDINLDGVKNTADNITAVPEIASTATDKDVKLIMGTYDKSYIFVIDLSAGKVSVYPLHSVDERTPSKITATGTADSDAVVTDSATASIGAFSYTVPVES